MDPDELRKLGEGTFEIKISHDGVGDAVTVDLIDKSDFNGGKEYLMDSFTVDAPQDNETFIIAGVYLELDDLDNLSQGDDGSFEFTNLAHKIGDGLKLQVGANRNQTIGLSLENMRSRELGFGGIEIKTVEDAQNAIERVDVAMSRVSTQRGTLGSVQNRLEHAISSIDNTVENLQASESRIRDVDMAKEMMELTKLNIMQQASQSMLAQANQAPQQVLAILS